MPGRISARAARAEVHRRHELKARGKHGPPGHTRDRDHTVLERLPQRLEHGPCELRELVEEEHTVVREARLARPRGGRAAADDCRRRRRVVRRPKRRRPRISPPPGASVPGDRMDARHLERPRRRRAAAGCPAAAGPASSCRSRAGRRGARCAPAAAISSARRARSWPRTSPRSGTAIAGRPRAAAAARAARACRAGTRPRLRDGGPGSARPRRVRPPAPDSAAQTSRLRRARRAPSAAISAPGTGRTRPSSASSPNAATSVERVGRQLMRRGEHREGDREVEPRALLAQARRAPG